MLVTRTIHAKANQDRLHPSGLARLVRERDDEAIELNLRRISRSALRQMETFLRYNDGRHHPIHPRLLRLLGTVSNHFSGRRLHVISGFRPFRRHQWTPHSNHNLGRAIDFRVEGVDNRTLRDFCRTLHNTGCGYYPRSVFVHMDVRDHNAIWVDWSRPGQRPMYGRENQPPDQERRATAAATVAPTASTELSPGDITAYDLDFENDGEPIHPRSRRITPPRRH